MNMSFLLVALCLCISCTVTTLTHLTIQTNSPYETSNTHSCIQKRRNTSALQFCHNRQGHRQHRDNSRKILKLQARVTKKITMLQVQNRIRQRHLRMKHWQTRYDIVNFWLSWLPTSFLAWFTLFTITMLCAPAIIIYTQTILRTLQYISHFSLFHHINHIFIVFSLLHLLHTILQSWNCSALGMWITSIGFVLLWFPIAVYAGDPCSANDFSSRNLPNGVYIIQLLSLLRMQKTNLHYLHQLLDILNLPNAKFTCSELLNEYMLGIHTKLQVFSNLQILTYKIQIQTLLDHKEEDDTSYPHMPCIRLISMPSQPQLKLLSKLALEHLNTCLHEKAVTFTTAHNFLDFITDRDTKLTSHSQKLIQTMRVHVAQTLSNVQQLPELTYELQLHTDAELSVMSEEDLSFLFQFTTQPTSLFVSAQNDSTLNETKRCLQYYSEGNINDFIKRIQNAQKQFVRPCYNHTQMDLTFHHHLPPYITLLTLYKPKALRQMEHSQLQALLQSLHNDENIFVSPDVARRYIANQNTLLQQHSTAQITPTDSQYSQWST